MKTVTQTTVASKPTNDPAVTGKPSRRKPGQTISYAAACRLLNQFADRLYATTNIYALEDRYGAAIEAGKPLDAQGVRDGIARALDAAGGECEAATLRPFGAIFRLPGYQERMRLIIGGDFESITYADDAHPKTN